MGRQQVPIDQAQRTRSLQLGMTLIELMIALTVLAIGMSATMLLFVTAAMTNSKTKTDTAGTMLAQRVLDQIAAAPADANPVLTVTDCNPNGAAVWNIATTGAAGVGLGATLSAVTGDIDFTQAYAAVPANYKMLYVYCGGGGRQITYDVRWNITTVSAATKMITVSARQTSVGTTLGANRAKLFALPVTLRTIGGH
ncbi:MAG TPA: prepilin-type N-terminal cleavage/methylation domain-containing protein [Terriglobales bacterium]|nr:prepilin-type N-terminal cleavage/methylation domain-containing protein [Terriglobales bacterium]